MIILIDNTVLSNFTLVQRIDLLQQAVGPTAAIPAHVKQEFDTGVQRKRLPTTDLSWLPVLTLSTNEQRVYQQFLQKLNAGEAACLAIASQRQGRVLTDDRDARLLANQLNVPISGTLGVLLRLQTLKLLSLSQADALLAEMITKGYRSPVQSLQELN